MIGYLRAKATVGGHAVVPCSGQIWSCALRLVHLVGAHSIGRQILLGCMSGSWIYMVCISIRRLVLQTVAASAGMVDLTPA